MIRTSPILICLTAVCLAVGGCGEPLAGFGEYMRNGQGEFDSQNYVAALSMFERASDLDPERPESAYFEGRCHMALAKEKFREDDIAGALRYCDRAVACFDRAVSAFPGYSRAVQGKADALKLKGRHTAALEIANWAATQSALHPNLMLVKAREYAQAGDLDRAQLTLQQLTKLDPEDAVVHAELGLFYMRCGNDPAAIESLKRAYELDPGAPGVVAALAHLGALSDVGRPG
jgi:tetratricopeptide (TPR) repeat protein